jgi:hypothetical protein
MSIFSAIGSFVAGPFGALASTALSSVLGAAAASQRRKQAIKDQDNQFVRMRNAAEKAGFNPLTVMRNGGAQMFGGVPTFSKAGFMQNFVQQGYNAWTTHADNDPLKKYNDEVRELSKRQTQASIDNMIANTVYTRKQTAALGSDAFDAPQSVKLLDSNGEPVSGSDGKPLYVPAESYEAIPKYKVVYDQNTKQMYAILNPELTETGPTELATGVGMDAAASNAAKQGLDLEWGGIGFPRDPLGLNRGFFSRSGTNETLAWPKN